MDTQPQEKLNILLVGDSCIDEYRYGRTDRISPEAPVPIFCETRSFLKEGMVFNVRNNLINFGCRVTLHTGIPSKKIRLIDERTERHILRIDNDVADTPLYISDMPEEKFNGVVVSDYGKGTITAAFVQELIQKYNVPVFVDTKKRDLSTFEGCIVKINEEEFKNATSYCSDLIVTLGSKGALYRDKIYPGVKTSVIDVCGAGDTFLAALAYFSLFTGKIELAIPLANKAAAVTVQHTGTYAPELKEFL